MLNPMLSIDPSGGGRGGGSNSSGKATLESLIHGGKEDGHTCMQIYQHAHMLMCMYAKIHTYICAWLRVVGGGGGVVPHRKLLSRGEGGTAEDDTVSKRNRRIFNHIQNFFRA
jgi:hypothetical protein